MQATIEILGKPVQIEWTATADRQLQNLPEPLLVEMELYFSCLIRKAVRFGHEAEAGRFVQASPHLKVGFRPVATRACRMSDVEGEPPLEDFPVVKPEAFVPKRLAIDYRDGQWSGEFSLQR